MSATDGVWLSINDYSRYKSVSVSTIRRHIKNDILRHREEEGKYLIYVPSMERIKLREEEEVLRLRLEVEMMKRQLRELRDENNELRMLVDLYENKGKGIAEAPPEFPIIHD
jgi:hydrogenase maturation factor